MELETKTAIGWGDPFDHSLTTSKAFGDRNIHTVCMGMGPRNSDDCSGPSGLANRAESQIDSVTPGRVLAIVRHGCTHLAEREPRLLNDLIAGLTSGTVREVDAKKIA